MVVCMDSLPLRVKNPVHLSRNRGELPTLIPAWVFALMRNATDPIRIHTPCPGQNTSITEGYTPRIVRIVHECFRDDVRSCKFDVPTYTSAAVPTHDDLIFTAAVSRLNPALSIRVQRGASLPIAANWTEILHEYEMEEAERASAREAEGVANPGDDVAAAGDDMSNQEATRLNTSGLVKRFWIKRASSPTWRAKLRCWRL